MREQLPLLAAEAYLNTGGAGPMPVVAARALERWAQAAPRRARGSLEGFEAVAAQAARAREAAGRVVGAPASRIALTANTTDGVNVVAWGLPWRPGDEIVMAGLEHPGLTVPLATVARRHGVRLRRVAPGGDLEAAVGAVAGPRTRLVALSHVSWATGERLDVEGAARAARAAGALLLVDGAQAAGAMPVDAEALGADAYAFPAHKWLLGPEGLGALWLSRGAIERLEITRGGFESGTAHEEGGGLTLHAGARRHEASTLPAALLGAWIAAIEWLEGLGWEWIRERTLAAAASARAALAAIDGVRLVAPGPPASGLVTFTVEGCGPQEACARIAARGVTLRWLERPAALRASTGFFTDDRDLSRLADAVRAVAARGDC